MRRLPAGARTTLLDPVTRGWAIVTAGSLARLAIGLLASVIIARTLGPRDLGTYALLAATAALAGALGEFGLTEAAVRRVGQAWERRPQAAAAQATAFVWLRTGSACLVVAILVLSLPLASRWLPSHDPRLLAFALLGVVAGALSGAVSAVLQATSRFRYLSLVMVSNAALTAILAAGLRLTGLLDLTTALLVLGAGTSLACFAVGRQWLPAGISLAWPGSATMRSEGRALLRFGSWLWIANTLAMCAARLDLFLAAHWLAPGVLGAYVVAVTLASKADVVNQSLHAALLPTAATLDSPRKVAAYLRRGLVRSAAVALLILPALPLARPLIPLLFGQAYREAAPLFLALLAIALFDLFAAPALLLSYSADQPQLLAVADAVRTVALLAGGIWLVPVYGVFGLIVAKLLAHVLGAAVTIGGLALRHPEFLWDPTSVASGRKG